MVASTVSPGCNHLGEAHARGDAGRAAAGDNVTGIQAHVGPPGDQFRGLVVHLPGIGVLAQFAVDAQFHIQVVGIVQFIRRYQPGTQGTGTFETLAHQDHLVRMLPGLDIPGGEVIEDGIARHVIEGFFDTDLVRLFTDDDGDFYFIIQLPGEDRDLNPRRRWAPRTTALPETL